MSQSESYTILEHRHRFAAWAACRAASVRVFCPFTVKEGEAILVAAGLKNLLKGPELLPAANRLDKRHRRWREAVINAASSRRERGVVGFTHGVAAKLINVYLKSAFVCGGFHAHPRVRALHPPIDRLLLEAIRKPNARGFDEPWTDPPSATWTKFDSDAYESVIERLRRSEFRDALWRVEEHWPGYQ